MPNSIVIFHQGGEQGEELEKLIPFIKEMRPLMEATAYVCQNYACQKPTGFKQFRRNSRGSMIVDS